MNIVNNHNVKLRGDEFSQEELNYFDLQGKQHLQVWPNKQRPKKHYVFIGMLIILLLVSSISSVVGYLIYQTYDARYQTDLSIAQTGAQHLQKAESLLATIPQRLLDTQFTNQAEGEFILASRSFSLLNNDLKALPVFVEQVPVYGARLDSALRLVSLAMTLSRAGVTGCNILNILVTGLHNPLNSQSHGITQSDLVVVSEEVKELQSEFVSATQQVNQLQPGDLQFDSHLPKLVNTFHKYAPAIQEWINTIQQLLPVAPILLGIGTPTNYLIEVLDSTELRPGGGFIGNYGIATLSGGLLSAAHITDVDLLDRPFEASGHTIPYPAAYKWFDLAPASWGFRDSNLDVDFPTAAKYGEQNYLKEGGKIPVQGVIAITPTLIERAFAIAGPIAVPEYHEMVTAQNLIARIHFHQLGGKAAGEGSDLIASPDGHSSLRKRFTELLAEHFLTRVRQLPSSDLSKLLSLMFNSVRSKDIQVFFNSNVAENFLHRFHLDDVIQAPANDSLFVVDANVAGNKANSFISSSINDHVTLDTEGNVVHHTTLSYAWTKAGPVYGPALYRDYVRVYVPPVSVLEMQDGWQPRGTGNAFKRKVWMGYFELPYGEIRTITLVWKVPAVASQDQSGWHYQYLVQRQAGILWTLNLQIILPTCAVITNKRGGLMFIGRQEAALTQSLTEDLNVGVDYNCK